MNVSDHVAQLRACSAAEIRLLPEKTERESVAVDGAPCTIITWHDEPAPGHHRVVVASYKRAMAGLATRVWAEGFVLMPDDGKRDLTEDELSPFQ